MIQMTLTRLLRRSKDGAIALMVLSTGCAATSWPMPSSVRYNPDFAVHSRLELDQVRMELGATRLAAPTEAAWASPLHNIQFLTSANGEVANTLRSQGNYIGAIRVAGGVVVAADSVIASRSERERARKWAWEIQGSSWQSLGFVGLSRIHFAFAGLAQTYLASTAAAQGDADFARQSTALDQSVARRNSAEESARSAANHASMVATQAMMHASNVQANAGSNSTETARARALASQALSTATTNDSLADQITSAANSNSTSAPSSEA